LPEGGSLPWRTGGSAGGHAGRRVSKMHGSAF